MARETRFWAANAAISSSALMLSASARIWFVSGFEAARRRSPRRGQERLDGGDLSGAQHLDDGLVIDGGAGLVRRRVRAPRAPVRPRSPRRPPRDRSRAPDHACVVDGDAQPAGVGAELARVRPQWRRRGVRIAGCGSVDRVEVVGCVAHAAGEPEVVGQPEQRLADVRACRDPSAARLESDQPAAGRGDPERAGAVAAVGDRHRAGRDQRGRAAAGAADAALEVPRVAGRPGPQRLGGEAEAELRAWW